MRWLGLGWQVRCFLEKLGMSEWKAFGYECKIVRFEDWLMRHPITNAIMIYDDSAVNKGWVEMTVNGSDMKLTSTTGIWRKTYTWTAQARIVKK